MQRIIGRKAKALYDSKCNAERHAQQNGMCELKYKATRSVVECKTKKKRNATQYGIQYEA
jgi:hypothetical protein